MGAKGKDQRAAAERLRAQGREGLRRVYDSFLPQMNLGMGGVPKRAAFIIDKNGVIQYAESNDDAQTVAEFRQDQSEAGGAEMISALQCHPERSEGRRKISLVHACRYKFCAALASLRMTETEMNDEFKTLRKFDAGKGREGFLYSLPALEEQGIGKISRLPVSIRIVLESVLRNCDGKKVRRKDVETLANWNAKNRRTRKSHSSSRALFCRILPACRWWSIWPRCAARCSGWAAIRKSSSRSCRLISSSITRCRSISSVQPQALQLNLDMEFKRNRERYQFLKWGQQAFKTFQLIPPGIGIVHQVNLEYLAKGVLSQMSKVGGQRSETFYPDTLVGTDSHTTMINGLGVVGWGVGGIEAEAGMLGQPVYFLTPEVVGVHLSGQLREGVTATDLVLHITQMLRAQKVVGKFVEFYGEGAASLPVPDRATIGNMSPEYGATMGFFPIDQESVNYLRATGRTDEQCAAFENYFRAQKMFGMPRKGEIDYSVDLDLDLADVQPSVAGPKRPQDRINLPELGETFRALLRKTGARRRIRKTDVDLREKHLVQLNGSAPRNGDMPSTDTKEDQGISPAKTATNSRW